MLEMGNISQRLGLVLSDVYVRLPSIMINATTDPTHFWFTSVFDDARWTLDQLIKIDEPHESGLYRVRNLGDSYEVVRRTTADEFSVFECKQHFESYRTIPDAYRNPLNSTSVDTETGPPFWYFGPSPPNETLLQQVDDFAIQA